MKMCDLEPDILPNKLIVMVILWKRPFWIYANEGEKRCLSVCPPFKCLILSQTSFVPKETFAL